MSCICGIVHFDQRPVDRDAISRMSASMRSSAPDGDTIDVRGHVGFAHNLLSTDKKSNRRRSALRSNAARMLVADARIDARADFLQQLLATGRLVDPASSDADVLLQAYDAYSDDLFNRLIGDFAFALWDGATQVLLLARDQFGARPIFYATIRNGIVFASQVRALLAHPEVSDEQDELAIGDFLMFGHFTDDSMTIYRQIRRIAGAHLVRASATGVVATRYWQPRIGSRIRYRDPEEYAQHFLDIFTRAVVDRLDGDLIAMEMSGGMDSTSIAAIASAAGPALGFELHTHTVSCKNFLPDDKEGHFAGVAASFLGVKNTQWVIGPLQLPIGGGARASRYTQPTYALDDEVDGVIISRISDSGARVMLTGIGGDVMFDGGGALSNFSSGTAEVLRQLADLIDYKKSHSTLRGLGIRAALMPVWSRPAGWVPDPLPAWFVPEFSNRTGMKDRWLDYWRGELSVNTLPQQFARRAFCAPLVPYSDHHLPIQVRHPFCDVRIANFCAGLSISAVAKKQPLVHAMRSQLPAEILRRPKTPLQGDLVHARLQARGGELDNESMRWSALASYVDQNTYRRALKHFANSAAPRSTWDTVYTTAPLCYLRWQIKT
jgi:asparagine synthase (glutamine-hydrolysing)